MTNFEEYIYIDYENVQDVKVELIKKTTKIIIFVGANQTKVPIELVQKTQKLGNSVEWISVNGKGRNALDFFIAYYLGKDVAEDSKKTFFIYSKDTGYDSLINYLSKSGIKVKRIVSFQELSQSKVINIDEAGIKKVKEMLTKIPANSRPKKRSSLTKYIVSRFNGIPKQDIDKIIEDIFIKKIVYEENGIIKYALNK